MPIRLRPVPVPSSPARLFVVADSTVENDINAFFPFDPYKLPGSSSFIDDIYREWSMVALDEDDSEEEENEDNQDVVVGEIGEEEEEVQLAHSFNEISISPRRVSLAAA
ncbi:hypothetical protein M407DRAFT_20648 [Tulasnella calospora MUT 4182]|uniref:Uncharacterized protein n=1 Tax=Tulasnella calospora MUT 4182 TaxID=1051891 RepID=A0A0C3QFI0_9AGAM|nr:hypothetical protein M407DRAFT_20648 [Tulasnella calospora MUT 4182]